MRPGMVRKEILLKRWPARMDGFNIALLSDFHYDPIFSIHPIQSAVEMVNHARPDLILLTGDFVTSPPLGIDHVGWPMPSPALNCCKSCKPLTAAGQ